MGGFGSGRWDLHRKKTRVEDCLKLPIYSYKPYLRPGFYGNTVWSYDNHKTSEISFMVIGRGEAPEEIRLIYSFIDQHDGEKTYLNFSVPLTTTITPWGAPRYWFVCQLSVNGHFCGQRVGVLYLPPGEGYFGCRHCYDLTYRSSQEEHRRDRWNRWFAASLQDDYPGITLQEVKRLREKDDYSVLYKYQLIREARWFAELEAKYRNYDPYPGYLSSEELCKQSGLDPSDVVRLESTRLLLTDRPSGRYRPKLVGWAHKLAYLLNEGWELEEIKRWAKGRFETEDPRHWPPQREDWIINNST